MANDKSLRKGIVYYIISAVFMLLTFGNIFAAFIAVPLAVGFALAASYHIKKFNPAIVLFFISIILYIIFGNLWHSISIMIYAVTAVLMLRFTNKSGTKFTMSIAWSSLVSAVLMAAIFLFYLYLEQGNLDLGIIVDPIKAFGAYIIDNTVVMLQYIYETAQLPQDTVIQIIEQFEYSFELIINNIISNIPGIYFVTVLIGVYVSHIIGKALTRKMDPRPIPAEGILAMRLSVFTGISYIVAYAVTIFATGSLLTVLLNYMTIIEIPLLVEGAISLFYLFTMKTENTAIKIIIGIAIGITICSIFINLSWIYVFIGAMDTYTDFRGKVRLYKQMKNRGGK